MLQSNMDIIKIVLILRKQNMSDSMQIGRKTNVLICIEMLKQMYMISEDKINKWIEKKQAREAERMEKNE